MCMEVIKFLFYSSNPSNSLAQLVGAVEYTESREIPYPNQCPGYDIKQTDGESPDLGNVEYSFIAIAPKSTLTWQSYLWVK